MMRIDDRRVTVNSDFARVDVERDERSSVPAR
jgi:hypothetical protein